MGVMVSQITRPAIVYSNVYLDADKRKHQSSASLTFVTPMNGEFPTEMVNNTEIFPFDDVTMLKDVQPLITRLTMASVHNSNTGPISSCRSIKACFSIFSKYIIYGNGSIVIILYVCMCRPVLNINMYWNTSIQITCGSSSVKYSSEWYQVISLN